MLDPTLSGCINHPGVEATTRCRQCGKPVCGTCTVVGPTGKFCSEVCREKHEQFVRRAQTMEQRSKMRGGFGRVRRALIKLTIFIGVICAIGYAAVKLDVPVAAVIFRKLFALILQFL